MFLIFSMYYDKFGFSRGCTEKYNYSIYRDCSICMAERVYATYESEFIILFDYLMSALASSIVAIQCLRINCLAFFSPGSVSTLSGSAITVAQCNRRNCAILIAGFL